MDRQGNIQAVAVLEEFVRSLSEKEVDSVPRKIESEQAQQAAFERQLAFRSAQAQNPIKGRPRRKRGRKVRK